MEYKCTICIKTYSSYKSLWNHNKNFHNKKTVKEIAIPIKQSELHPNECKYCNRIFTRKNNMVVHRNKTCKERKDIIHKLKEELKVNNSTHNKIINNTPSLINNQLINIIIDKNKTIEELKNKPQINILFEDKKIEKTLIINNISIISRSEDHYVNATKLCLAGKKKLNDWICLKSIQSLINEFPSHFIINEYNIKLQDSWIHPDLAIQLAQWISPQFALLISKWIRTIFISDNLHKLNDMGTNDTSINKGLLDEIKVKDTRIKLLEDIYLKKHKRTEYCERNVIYMLTTEDHKKKRLYIIGKAINLKNRLSSYNKTSEHEVVYYKACKSEENMNVIENMVLTKLANYKEKANRDRFILPIEKDINYFTNIIDLSIEFF